MGAEGTAFHILDALLSITLVLKKLFIFNSNLCFKWFICTELRKEKYKTQKHADIQYFLISGSLKPCPIAQKQKSQPNNHFGSKSNNMPWPKEKKKINFKHEMTCSSCASHLMFVIFITTSPANTPYFCAVTLFLYTFTDYI